MSKKVRYNGGVVSCYACTNPRKLVEGKVYEVISSRGPYGDDRYILDGVDGIFASEWFDEIPSDDEVYMVIADEFPVIDERYFCYKMEFISGQPKFVRWSTSTVKRIHYMGNNIYQVTTRDSVCNVLLHKKKNYGKESSLQWWSSELLCLYQPSQVD